MSPLGNEDARAQVGTNGGLSQRWSEVEYDSVEPSSFATYRACARELDAAKVRIEEAAKALVTVDGKDVHVPYWAMLKIIREIL